MSDYEVTPRWHVQRAEVIVPSSFHLAGVLIMGTFALSLAGMGVLYSIWRRVRHV